MLPMISTAGAVCRREQAKTERRTMGIVMANSAMWLDGVIAGPNHEMDWMFDRHFLADGPIDLVDSVISTTAPSGARVGRPGGDQLDRLSFLNLPAACAACAVHWPQAVRVTSLPSASRLSGTDRDPRVRELIAVESYVAAVADQGKHLGVVEHDVGLQVGHTTCRRGGNKGDEQVAS